MSSIAIHTIIHRPRVDFGDTRGMDLGDATRSYPLDFGDAY